MKSIAFLLIAVSVFARACGDKSETPPPGEPEGFGTARTEDLQVVPVQEEMTLQWGVPTDFQVDVAWAENQKYPVQLVPAEGTPDWLEVSVRPVIINPPGSATVTVTAQLGADRLGKRTLRLEAGAYDLKKPVECEIDLEIIREKGGCHLVTASTKTLECRNICAKVADGRVTFYDVLREYDQSCGDKAALPDSQRIGFFSFGLSSKGYGFGRTCQVAAVYGGGALSLVNLGMPGAVMPRGEVLLKVVGADACWMTPDNTIALIGIGSAYTPYDVYTGAPLGMVCRVGTEVEGVTFDGTTLTAFSSVDCVWEIR